VKTWQKLMLSTCFLDSSTAVENEFLAEADGALRGACRALSASDWF